MGGGIIDFDTDCPWQLYLFAFIHIGAGLVMYLLDSCKLLTSTNCSDSEHVFETMIALSFLYVGVIFTVLTYYNKDSVGKITRLSNAALNGAVALLVAVIFTGNASYGGIERSWMHKGDMLTMMLLVFILWARVSKTNIDWAQKNSLNEDLGINCKTLLILFTLISVVKLFALTDFVDPNKMLADDSKMTEIAYWMWKICAVTILEFILAITYSILYDDNTVHELLTISIMIMSLIAVWMFSSVQKYMSSWMGLNKSSTLWIRVGILLVLCTACLIGGRRSSHRSGYQNV